jgi:hypothetical protein
MTIDVVFDPPLPSDSREDFNQKAFDTVAKLNSWSSEANQTAEDINDMVTSPGVIAIGSDLAGANTIGAVAAVAADVSVVAAIDADVSAVAAIAADVSAVAANEANINAAVADLPALSAKVSKTGDTMTGHLSVPAGATGNQVPRSSEVVHMTGDETIAGVKTFSSSPIVPAGATGDEVPQAQEIYGKSQTEQTVTRTNGVTYTNSTGKPIVVTASATTTNEDNVLYGYRNGAVVVWSSWPEVPTELNIEFTVFPGATYKLEVYGATDLLVKEYR